jgi:cytochrome c peroxidase
LSHFKQKTVTICTLFILSGCGSGGGSSTSFTAEELAAKKIVLGEFIFNDVKLSTPAGQSCATCHDSEHGFADGVVDTVNPVSEGAVIDKFGNRNSPTASYASFVPAFHFNALKSRYEGGLFLDGRAATLTEQAKEPFLNSKEMNNADETEVISKIKVSEYADLFKEVYGDSSLDNVTAAYNQMAQAIAAYESTEEFQPFTAKFDYFLAGEVELSEAERRGFELFKGLALCTDCHTLPEKGPSVFSDFTYRNIGTPVNPNLSTIVDLGLGAVLNESSENGKFRVSTLRNIELTAPYMHNGVFQTLEDVVRFYNTRIPDQCGDSPFLGCWDAPEVSENVENTTGDLGLTGGDEADIVAFLKTLTDGYL